MKRIALSVTLLLYVFNLKAQYASLNKKELHRLQTEIAKDDAVKNLFSHFKARADKALGEAPNPIEKIRSEGLLMGNPLKTATLKAVEDVPKIYVLALVYRLSNQSVYLNKAVEFLLAWAKLNQASGNPIDETKLHEAIVAYDLIRNNIKPGDRSVIDNWLASIADAEVNSPYAKPERSTSKNNWNSHRIKIITLIACTIHQEKYYETIDKELKDQIQKNLYPDGTGFDFKERDALHYHIYDLEPLLTTAITLKRATGRDYFNYQSPTGSSIKKSVDFLVPFVTGEKTHVEFVNSKVRFDRERAKNNEQGYQLKNFVPSTGIGVLSQASYFDPQYIKDIQKSTQNNDYLNWEMVINAVRK